MHFGAFAAVAQMLQLVPAPTRVVEIGALNINGSVRPLFNGATYVGVDRVAGPDVDVVSDGSIYQPDVSRPDCVVCCEVLEHASNWKSLVMNMASIVRPGGTVIITCAGENRVPHSAVDGGLVREDEYYQNVPLGELTGVMTAAGLNVLYAEYRPDRCDIYACGVKPCAS
jgi:hypothetical protein